MVINKRRQTMTGCLRQAHSARNNGVEYHVTQTGSNIICELLCKAISPIIYGERNTHDGKTPIKSEIGREHVLTPVTTAQLVLRLSLEKNTNKYHTPKMKYI